MAKSLYAFLAVLMVGCAATYERTIENVSHVYRIADTHYVFYRETNDNVTVVKTMRFDRFGKNARREEIACGDEQGWFLVRWSESPLGKLSVDVLEFHLPPLQGIEPPEKAYLGLVSGTYTNKLKTVSK